MLVSRLQLLVILLLITVSTFPVDIVAFQPLALVGRIGSCKLLPGEFRKAFLPPSTGGSATPAPNNVPLKFSEKEDDRQDGLVMPNALGESVKNKSISNDEKVDALLALLDSVPSNLPTSRSKTDEILDAVKNLEETCPTSDDLVLSELSGNWELLWTAQDKSSEQYLKGGRIINPLENQSYSNNPFMGSTSWLFGEDGNNNNDSSGGRANPVLPREIQDVLERTGILEASGGTKLAPIRSSQGIDIRRKRVRNVVNVQFKRPFPIKGSLIVDVDFKPNPRDERRVDVKFDSCRFVLQNARVDRTFPLGVFGPRGWLRTGYVDDRIRITRGHKGSVFILSRTAKRRSV